MSFRKILFWLHLCAGLIAGLAIAIMCFTGATLAFEQQLVAWAERDARVVSPPMPPAETQPLDTLLAAARDADVEGRPSALTISSNPRAAVAIAYGRDATLYANPYTAEIRAPASTQMRDFLHTMEQWHRWLALSGDARPIGKLVNGIANAAFLVLAVTGLYLWLPRRWSWQGVRAVAIVNLRLAGKARDFNWHNAIGLWCAPVLIVLTLTALPMSFRWANTLVYTLAGDTAPAPGGPGGFGSPAVVVPAPSAGARPLTLDALLARVKSAYPDWSEITLRLASGNRRGEGPPTGVRERAAAGGRRRDEPRSVAARTEPGASGSVSAIAFVVRQPGAWPRIATTTVSLDPFTGATLRVEDFAALSAGRQARMWTRFLHTGEAVGWIGQLLAGLACVGGCFLVYTGFVLSWRRFFGRGA